LTAIRCATVCAPRSVSMGKVPKAFSTVPCLSWSSCLCNLIALHESDQGATPHRPAFAIGGALAVSFDHLIGADHDGRWDCQAERFRRLKVDN
jgi:hypothetical protein